MIPLLRPDFPSLLEVDKLFSVCHENNIYTNFGKLFYESVERLSVLMRGEALPTSSGTTAIQVALSTMNAKGKRVAIPDYTHSGTLLAVIAAQAKPVLFPVDQNWIISKKHLKDHWNEYDMAVIVSPFGYDLDVHGFESLSVELKKPFVYDFAGSFGRFPETINPRCYSFHATKNFSVGEGGCVVLPDLKMWQRAQWISNFYTNPEDRSILDDTGGNLKVDELRCALILQMLKPKNLSAVYKKIENKNALLSFYEEKINTAVMPEGEKHTSLCVLNIKNSRNIEPLLYKSGIQAKSYYPLLSSMTGLAHIDRVGHSDESMKDCLALPSDVSLSEALKVVECVNGIIKSSR